MAQRDKKRKLTITMHDVAERAGVSTATVSRVFKYPDKTSEKTRRHVEEISNLLGYYQPLQPKVILNRILVLMADLYHPHHVEILAGIKQSAIEKSVQVMVCSLPEETSLIAWLNYLAIRQIKGCIVLGQADLLTESHQQSTFSYPIVYINHAFSVFPCFNIDYLSAAYQAVEALIQHGHHHILYVADQQSWMSQYTQQGYQQALTRYGLMINNRFCFQLPLAFESGVHVLKMIASLVPRPTAIFCTSSIVAMGIIYQAKSMGITIPAQLSLICFHDNQLVEDITPWLTHIRLPLRELGYCSGQSLINYADKEQNQLYSKMMTTQLIKRQSIK